MLLHGFGVGPAHPQQLPLGAAEPLVAVVGEGVAHGAALDGEGLAGNVDREEVVDGLAQPVLEVAAVPRDLSPHLFDLGFESTEDRHRAVDVDRRQDIDGQAVTAVGAGGDDQAVVVLAHQERPVARHEVELVGRAVPVGHRLDLGDDRPLELEALEHRLDDQVAAREVMIAGGRRDQAEHGVGLFLRGLALCESVLMNIA